MAQITITIPDRIEEMLREIAINQGRPFSQLAALCLEQGFYEQLEKLNKSGVYDKLANKRKEEDAKNEHC